MNIQIRSSTFSDNSTDVFYGGGIFVYSGNFSLSDSTVSGNAAEYGAGIYLTASTQGTISGSAIINNSALTDGGGIYVLDSRLTVANSTFSGNVAQGFGGGIATYDSTLVFRHSTITGNRADADGVGDERAGGVSLGGIGTLTLDHTILAENFRALSSRSDAFGVIGARYSIVGVDTDTLVFDFGGNLIGTSISRINPGLEPLANNGGPTMTHALLPGSPAIDRGDPVFVAGIGEVPAFDQRGTPFTRVANGDAISAARVDIGAFERQAFAQALPGDYNLDGFVDAADYVLWRKTLADNVAAYSGADGDGDGVIDQDDHTVWRANFGRSVPRGVGSMAAFVSDLRQEVEGRNIPGQVRSGELREASNSATRAQFATALQSAALPQDRSTPNFAQLKRPPIAETALNRDTAILSWYLLRTIRDDEYGGTPDGGSVGDDGMEYEQDIGDVGAAEMDAVLTNWKISSIVAP